ncbi:MAG: hypothetical protein R3F02_02305 [Thiolinea sp.]
MKLYLAFIGAALTAAGCAVNSGSEIPGQLDDGGWVKNVPGKPHTHRVVLSDCPDQPVVTTHTHDHELVGQALHKHNGCFTCPVNETLASRLLN